MLGAILELVRARGALSRAAIGRHMVASFRSCADLTLRGRLHELVLDRRLETLRSDSGRGAILYRLASPPRLGSTAQVLLCGCAPPCPAHEGRSGRVLAKQLAGDQERVLVRLAPGQICRAVHAR